MLLICDCTVYIIHTVFSSCAEFGDCDLGHLHVCIFSFRGYIPTFMLIIETGSFLRCFIPVAHLVEITLGYLNVL